MLPFLSYNTNMAIKKRFLDWLILFFLVLLSLGLRGFQKKLDSCCGCFANGNLVGNRSNTNPCNRPITPCSIPNFRITSIETAALPYANKNIYLFLGGFLIALSIERSGLHKRLALIMIKSVGSNGPKLIGGFMLVSALISMWVMNTSTTLMLLPIGLAICSVVANRS